MGFGPPQPFSVSELKFPRCTSYFLWFELLNSFIKRKLEEAAGKLVHVPAVPQTCLLSLFIFFCRIVLCFCLIYMPVYPVFPLI